MSNLADVFLLVIAAQIAIYTMLVSRRVATRRGSLALPLNFCLLTNISDSTAQNSPRYTTYRILANSLLIRFSSSSRALALRRSAMNCTRPRMFELLLAERPRKLPVADIVAEFRV